MTKVKKYKLLILLIVIVFVIIYITQGFSGVHWWFGFTYETNKYYNNNSATIVKVNFPSKKVVIPSTICFHKVWALGGYVTGRNLWGVERTGMFEDNDIVEEVIISEGIESIGDRCFNNAVTLKSVELPSTIKELSFTNCKNLKNVKFNGEVNKIENLSFYGCSSLETLIIPDSISDDGILQSAFLNCSALNSINIPDAVTIIYEWTFSNCTSLNQLTLSENITSIKRGAFENCTSLEKINIYEKCTEIADNAFDGCDKLTIYGIKGSYAEQYANEHNIPFNQLA